MKAHWWHLRGKASAKGEQLAQVSSVRACNSQQLCSAGILFCRCPVCLVTSSSHISHLTVRSRGAVYGPLQESRELLASAVQMPHWNMLRNLSLPVGKTDHASFERLVGVQACGWGAALHLSTWRWSSGRQWGQAPSQAGSGGPAGCPIINAASLGEVLEHSLEPSPPPSQMVGFGSRSDSKSFEFSPQKRWNEVRQS